MPEIFIGVATLRLGLQDFLKAQIVGGIIVNLLLVLGLSMLFGGLRYHLQKFNTTSARSYSSLMLLAIVALLFPSAFAVSSKFADSHRVVILSIYVAIILLVTYVLYLVFSLRLTKTS
jgi:Ca2+:H+ antiporter